jgi:hypothetical protein
MGNVKIKNNSKEEFKPIKINIEVTVDSLKEYNDLMESLRQLDDDYGYDSTLLERIINELYTTI